MLQAHRAGRWALIMVVALLSVLVLAPIVSMFASSLAGEGMPSLSAYRRLLTSARQWGLLRNSLLTAGATSLAAIVTGLTLGFLLTRIKFPFRRFFIFFLIIPAVVPSYVFAMAWIQILGKRGLITVYMERLVGLREPILNLYGMPGTVLVLSLSYFPIVMLTTCAAFGSIDARHEEAGRLYVGWKRTLLGVTLKQVMPASFTGGVLVFVLSLANFGVPSLLGLHVYTLEIYSRFNAFYDVGGATASALPLVALSLLALLGYRLYIRGRSHVTLSGHVRRAAPIDPGAWRWVALGICFGVAGVSVALPLAVLLRQAGGPASYAAALQSAGNEIMNSLLTAALAATALVLFAFPTAYAVARWKTRATVGLDFLALVPFAIPGTILGVGLIRLWNRPGLMGMVYGSVAILVLAYAARFFSIAHRGLSLGIERIDNRLEEAAAVSGVSWFASLRKVVFPLLWPAVAAVWILTFILSLGELGASVLVSPPGFTTLPVRIFTLMHYGMNQVVAALAVMLLLCVLAPLAALSFIALKRFRVGHASH